MLGRRRPSAFPLVPLLLHFILPPLFLRPSSSHQLHRCRLLQWPSSLTVFQMLLILLNSYLRLSMMCSISSRLLGHLCPPDFAGGREPSSRRPGWSLTRWREMASFVTLPVPGPPLLTWWPRRTVPGGLAATSGGSISSQSPTGTHFPTCWTSRIGSMGAALSPRSTCGRAAGRSP